MAAQGTGLHRSLVATGAIAGTLAGTLFAAGMIAWNFWDLTQKTIITFDTRFCLLISCYAALVGGVVGAPIGALVGGFARQLARWRRSRADRAAQFTTAQRNSWFEWN
jgi:hypothetical protein